VRAGPGTLKVLAVVHYPVFGGPHNQILRLAGPLRAHGVETIALLPREAEATAARLRDAGITVVTTGLHRLRASKHPGPNLAMLLSFPREVLAIRGVIRRLGIDVVQIGGMVNPHAAFAARIAGRPVVWQLVDVGTPRPVATVAMLLVRALAAVVMSSGRTVVARAPFGRGIRRMVPYLPPVDTELFRPRPERRAPARRALGVPEDVPVVGCVANINREKGITDLVEAFGLVHAEVPDARLVLIGAEHDTQRSYASAIRARIGELGIGDRVHFVGERSDLPDLLPAFDVAVLASRSEGTPTVLMEAMSTGAPVVATDVGGVAEIVSDGVSGTLVPPGDPVAFASAIVRILRDRELAARMSRAARERAVADFAIEASLRSHLRAYELARTASEHRGTRPR
jgi:glycosyltransferase involved in cell wall biosynthesis